MARSGVAVTGYKEFLKACAQGGHSTRKFVREAFRDVGEVVRADAAVGSSRSTRRPRPATACGFANAASPSPSR